MSVSKLSYGTTTAITITLASLANVTSVTSSTIDNTTNLFLDANVEVIIVTGASGTTTTGFIEVFVKGSIDNTDFSSDTADRKIGVIGVAANSTTYKGVFSVSQAFGGALPPYWQIRIRNAAGGALAAAGNSAAYRGVFVDIV